MRPCLLGPLQESMKMERSHLSPACESLKLWIPGALGPSTFYLSKRSAGKGSCRGGIYWLWWQGTNRSVSWQGSGDPEPPVQWHTVGDSL